MLHKWCEVLKYHYLYYFENFGPENENIELSKTFFQILQIAQVIRIFFTKMKNSNQDFLNMLSRFQFRQKFMTITEIDSVQNMVIFRMLNI
jgi:hypothetical protein